MVSNRATSCSVQIDPAVERAQSKYFMISFWGLGPILLPTYFGPIFYIFPFSFYLFLFHLPHSWTRLTTPLRGVASQLWHPLEPSCYTQASSQLFDTSSSPDVDCGPLYVFSCRSTTSAPIASLWALVDTASCLRSILYVLPPNCCPLSSSCAHH